MSNPFIDRAKPTPIPRTFVNIYDQPKKPGAKARVVEVFEIPDLAVPNAANKAFYEASNVYAHCIGVVVYTKQALESWTKKK